MPRFPRRHIPSRPIRACDYVADKLARPSPQTAGRFLFDAPMTDRDLAIMGLVQLRQIAMLLLPDDATGEAHPSAVKGARVLVDGLIADLQREADVVPAAALADSNVVPLRKSQ